MSAGGSVPEVLLPSKLQPPRTHDGVIARARVLRALDDTPSKVSIMVAPAGFGKTTLLTQWVEQAGRPVAWLSLDAQDNAPVRFMEYVIGALATIDPDLDSRVRRRAATHGEAGVRELQQALLYEIAHADPPWILVLDDYHVLTHAGIHALVVQIITAMPAGGRLVIAGRTEPPLPTARLRIQGELTLLDADDLRATPDEATLLFAHHDLQADAAQIAVAREQVGGWLLGLHLIAHAAKQRSIGEILGTLSTLDEDMALLNEFLLQEVLEQQEPELRAFLLKISIMDRFTPGACFATTRQPAAYRFLDTIRRRGMFIIDLDERGEWLRFHHVFQDFLRARLLVETEPDVVRGLYAAAGRWHAEHGLFSEAIRFSLAAEEWQRAAALIQSVASEMIFRHRLTELFGWLHSLPESVVQSNPNLSTITAFGLIRDGRAEAALAYLDAAERVWRAEGFGNGLAMVEMNRAMAGRFRGSWLVLFNSAVKAIAFAPGEQALDAQGRLADVHPRMFTLEGTWRDQAPQAASYQHLALALLLLGRTKEAGVLVPRLQLAWAEQGYDMAAIPTGGLVPMLYLAQGRLELAETFARPLAGPVPADRPTERALSAAVLAEVLYEWNRLDDAEQVVRAGLQMLEHAHASAESEPLQMLLGQVLWAQGDAAGALVALESAATTAEQRLNLTYLHEAQALRVQQELATGDREQARRWSLRRGLSVTGALESASTIEWLVYARMLIATDEAEQALLLLRRLREDAEREGHQHHLIKILALKSLTYLDLFDLDRAAETLATALAAAEEGRYVRVFIGEGNPMLRLLRIAHRRGASVQYIRDLLAEVGEAPEEVVRIAHQQLVEPITSREVQVLGLIAMGLTNKEIAEELYLSVATVKRHVTNLFGKLGVSNRTDAVHLARRLNLLSEEAQTSALQRRTHTG